MEGDYDVNVSKAKKRGGGGPTEAVRVGGVINDQTTVTLALPKWFLFLLAKEM